MLKRRVSERTTLLLFVVVFAGLSAWSWLRYWRFPIPERFPLFSTKQIYTDLTAYQAKMWVMHGHAATVGGGYPVFNYLAPAAYVYSAVLHSPHSLRTFMVVVLGPFAALLAGAAWWMARRGLLRALDAVVLVGLAVSYPMLLVASRANLEGVVWVVTTGFLLLLLADRDRAAAVLLGLAMSVKPFPGVFVVLFLLRRRWVAAAISVGVAAATVLLALHGMGPTVVGAYRGLQPGIELYAKTYATAYRPWFEQGYTHGLLDSLKVCRMWLGMVRDGYGEDQMYLERISLKVMALYGLGVLGVAGTMVWRLRRMPLLNVMFGCGIALTLLPPSCADYTLCVLYVPLLLLGYFLATEVRGGRQAWTAAHAGLLVFPLACLMAPMTFLGTWGSVVRCVLLLVLLGGVCALPLRLERRVVA